MAGINGGDAFLVLEKGESVLPRWKARSLINATALSGALALVLAACGSSPPTATSSSSTHQSGTTSASDSAGSNKTSTTTTTAASATQASMVGQVLLDQSSYQAACNQASSQVSSVSGTTNPNAVNGSNLGSNAGSTVTFSPSGLAILVCSTQSTAFIAGFNLYTKSVAWTVDLSPYADYGIGSEHLFLLQVSQSAGNALNSGTTSYRLIAKSLDTGATSWSSPLPDGGQGPSDGSTELMVTEGPSGDSANTEEAVLTISGTYGFDSSNGQLLWHTSNIYDTQASGGYIGYGIVENGNLNGAPWQGTSGYNASTNTQAWQLPYPTVCTNDSNSFYTEAWADQVVGNQEWLFSPGCYFAYVYQTGQVVASGVIPSSWTSGNNASFVASPSGALVDDGTNLAYYTWSDLTSPAWSVAANSATPLAIGSSRVLVTGATGEPVFLSISNGSIIGSLPKSVSLKMGVVTNGLLVEGDTVIDMDPPASG